MTMVRSLFTFNKDALEVEFVPKMKNVSVWASLVALTIKNLPAMQETWIQSLGWEDSLGEGNGYPLQYSCLENPMDRGAWRAMK